MPRQYSVSELAELLRNADPARFRNAGDKAIVELAVAANPQLRSWIAAKDETRVAPQHALSTNEIEDLPTVYPVRERVNTAVVEPAVAANPQPRLRIAKGETRVAAPHALSTN